jgi:hypothetical protein
MFIDYASVPYQILMEWAVCGRVSYLEARSRSWWYRGGLKATETTRGGLVLCGPGL